MLELRDFPSHDTLKTFARRFPELDVTALMTWLTLIRVASGVITHLEDYLSNFGLSQRKFFILILLMRNPNGLNISQLAEGTGVSCATMTGVVDRMKKAQLVTRETAPDDRRVLVVRITPKGEELMNQVLPLHYRRVAELMSPLDEEERQQLQVLLGKIELNSGEGSAIED